VANLVCAEKGDCRRRGKDRRAREESGELRTKPPPGSEAEVIRITGWYCEEWLISGQHEYLTP
jgi:hypothetical protein